MKLLKLELTKTDNIIDEKLLLIIKNLIGHRDLKGREFIGVLSGELMLEESGSKKWTLQPSTTFLLEKPDDKFLLLCKRSEGVSIFETSKTTSEAFGRLFKAVEALKAIPISKASNSLKTVLNLFKKLKI